MKTSLFLITLCVCTATSNLYADTIELTAVKDNTLFSNGNSGGGNEFIFSGRTGTGSNPDGIRQRAVMAFDVAGSIPAGSMITSASLTLTVRSYSGLNQVDQVHTLHRLLADWGEGTSSAFGGEGASPTTGDATWLHTFYPDEFWTNEGGDFEPDASSSQTVSPEVGPYTWPSTPMTVADVQLWLDDPESNYGWLLMGNEGSFRTARNFDSRESGFVDQRPTLSIEFDPPPCPADCGDPINGEVEITDLLTLLAQWGGPGTCDLDGDGVTIDDLLILLAAWGPCE